MQKKLKIILIVFGLFMAMMILNILQSKVFDDGLFIKVSETDNKSEESDGVKSVKNIAVIINGKKYNATIEDNETAEEFVKRLPQEFDMEELNGNEKYVYMDYSLPTNSVNPKHIKSGDMMLYGDNCLVIFYKSFDTNYSYTKIGHIDDLGDLGIDDIIVKLER